jgi:hypothetical protein
MASLREAGLGISKSEQRLSGDVSWLWEGLSGLSELVITVHISWNGFIFHDCNQGKKRLVSIPEQGASHP